MNKGLTYEPEHSGDCHIRDGRLLISGLSHPRVHQRPQLLAVKPRSSKWTSNFNQALQESFSSNLNLRFRINSTGTLHVPIKEDNIPQYIIICPLPLLVSTQQVQSEDVFPGLGSWFKAVAAVFGERLSWSGPKVSQSCGDQIVNATRRSLQRQREIRVILLHWRQSDDVIGIDSLKGFKG